ncbi:capsule polysaccharide transporter [Sphingomonas sp. PAMC 26621]|uniref:capsule polysaccharide transporter n=1 Tax=Sphingomonas sp. PAMC 26621 TaxID=1112213 RepID=UPI00028964E1|nr:capsule polysaccharide transporter [Sphingomonas sp. PAMC 26621]
MTFKTAVDPAVPEASPDPEDRIALQPHAPVVPRLLKRRADPEDDGWGEDLDPIDADLPEVEIPPHRRRRWFQSLFLLLVLLPTLVTVAFEYLIVSDQFESEASFIVRAPQSASPGSGLSQILGMSTGAVPADAHSVAEYLLSHDAIDSLGRGTLIAMFRRPEADPATRLWSADPAPETLLRFYRHQVHIANASETGITALRVRAFRPADAKALADRLLVLGEIQVGNLNRRMFEDGLKVARRQIVEAEATVEQAQIALTAFRQARRDVDPEKTGSAQIQTAASLQEQTAQARASLEAMAATVPSSAPQYAATARRVAAMERQVATAQARLAGSNRSVAGGLGDYEHLRLRQEFASKRYEAAAASFQAAREQLLKQQLFIVPVVKPNLPGKALYPKRLETVATVFFTLAFAFAIGWLILAGVHEHAE